MALTQSFCDKVDAIEKRLKMEPGSLLSVIDFETGGKFLIQASRIGQAVAQQGFCSSCLLRRKD